MKSFTQKLNELTGCYPSKVAGRQIISKVDPIKGETNSNKVKLYAYIAEHTFGEWRWRNFKANHILDHKEIL